MSVGNRIGSERSDDDKDAAWCDVPIAGVALALALAMEDEASMDMFLVCVDSDDVSSDDDAVEWTEMA